MDSSRAENEDDSREPEYRSRDTIAGKEVV
jgi:hypothetical protein